MYTLNKFGLLSIQKGFHLMEILITVAIIAIMSQWVMANYEAHIAKARRHQAVIALYNLATALEDYALAHQGYRGATLTKLHLSKKAADNRYILQIHSATTSAYLIAAHPDERQAKSDIDCGSLFLTSTGVKETTGHHEGNLCF